MCKKKCICIYYVQIHTKKLKYGIAFITTIMNKDRRNKFEKNNLIIITNN